MAICKQCNKDISQTEGKRVKLYCSDACRKAYNRSLPDKIDDSLPDKPLTDNPLKALPDKVYTKQGLCHGCGKEVKHYICLCYECVASGITHKSLNLNISKCDY